jgi:hypothetical protein
MADMHTIQHFFIWKIWRYMDAYRSCCKYVSCTSGLTCHFEQEGPQRCRGNVGNKFIQVSPSCRDCARSGRLFEQRRSAQSHPTVAGRHRELDATLCVSNRGMLQTICHIWSNRAVEPLDRLKRCRLSDFIDQKMRNSLRSSGNTKVMVEAPKSSASHCSHRTRWAPARGRRTPNSGNFSDSTGVGVVP